MESQKQYPETSSRNPDQNANEQMISFKIKSAITLKKQLEVLEDVDFNPNGTVDITLWNNAIGVAASNPRTKLLTAIVSDAKRDGRSQNPVVCSKLINLTDLCKHLVVVNDDDSIEVCHVVGSKEVSFNLLGPGSSRSFSMKFSDHTSGTEDLLIPNDGCQVVISTGKLKEIIRHLGDPKRRSTSKNITFRVEDDFLRTGLKDTLEITSPYHIFEKGDQVYNISRGQTLEAEFDWPHWKSLEKASNLAEEVKFYFPSKKPWNLCLRFLIGDFHRLFYVMDEARMKKFNLFKEH